MPDYINGADISHFQERPSFDKLVDDDIRFVLIKAWQGNSPDPDYEWSRQQAEDRNMPHFAYIFDVPSDTEASLKRFAAFAGTGVIGMLDWEQAGVTSQIIELGIDVCRSDLGRDPLVYRGKWPPAPVTPKIATCPWYYAQYPGSTTAAPRVPLWDGIGPYAPTAEAFIWQWTGMGRLPGINTKIDQDRIACPWDVFRRWYETGEFNGADQPKGAPAPPPQLPAQATPIARTLHLGCSGQDVTKLQERLTGYIARPLVFDGEFGIATAAAVKEAQTKLGLRDDGIAGTLTLHALGLA